MTAPPPPPAAFLLDAAGPLALPAQASDEALWHALSHRVMRRPGALDAHVRRLALCRRPASRHRAAGALADLLHALDGRGRPLAARMLGALGGALHPAQRELMADWLAGRRPPARALDALPGRVLPSLGAHLVAAAGDPGPPSP